MRGAVAKDADAAADLLDADVRGQGLHYVADDRDDPAAELLVDPRLADVLRARVQDADDRGRVG